MADSRRLAAIAEAMPDCGMFPTTPLLTGVGRIMVRDYLTSRQNQRPFSYLLFYEFSTGWHGIGWQQNPIQARNCEKWYCGEKDIR